MIFQNDKMKRIFKCLLIILMMFPYGCKNDNRIEKEIRTLYGQKICIPKGCIFMKSDDITNVQSLFNKDVKILTYIDDFQCTSCMHKMVMEWGEQVKRIFKKDVPYGIVMSSEQYEPIEELLKEYPIGTPVLLYKTDVFAKNNNLKSILSCNRTFMLDKHNQIVVVGEPFGNEKRWAIYKKVYKILKKEYSHKRE